MSWYEPIYGYFPEEIAEELGEDALTLVETLPSDRPAMVYAGKFSPEPAPGQTVPPATARPPSTTRR